MGRVLCVALALGLAGCVFSQNALAANASSLAGRVSLKAGYSTVPTPSLDIASSLLAPGLADGNTTYLLASGRAAVAVRANGRTTYATSPIHAAENAFPETMYLTLFGTGLLGIALMFRRRAQRALKGKENSRRRRQLLSEVGRMT